MTDGRQSSPSDDLLGRARGDVAGDIANSDGFVPSSPADDYVASLGIDTSVTASDDDGGDAPLSAAEIAAALKQAEEASAPAGPGPASEPTEPAPQAREPGSLPSGAVDDSPPAPAEPPMTSDVTLGSGGQDPTYDPWSTASPEWEAYQAQRDAKRAKRSGFDIPIPRGRALGGILVLVIMGIGFLISVFDGKESIQNTAVGDCLIVGEALEIDLVPVVDCAEPHDAEVLGKVDMAAMGLGYVEEDAMFTWLHDECVEFFPSYVGEAYETSEWYIDMFIPTRDGWNDGDRTGICTVVAVDDDLNITSVTGTARSSGANA